MAKQRLLFSGVKIVFLTDHADDRGFFREVARKTWKISKIGQVSISQTKPGVIKAFHWHERQSDAWHLLQGRLIVGLHDLRKNSKSFGQTVLFEWDAQKNPFLLVIPKKIAHGYKVIGPKDALMLYMMDNEYDPKKPDEKRMAFDDPKIGADWKKAPAYSISDFLP